MLDYSSSGTEAITSGTESWFSNKHFDSINNITAHEVGHALGRHGHSWNLLDLMVMYSGNPNFMNPCVIRKADWVLVNPNG